MKHRKLVVIGLDGATFDLIDPLVREGRLPTFGHLLAIGARARLRSTIPPATIPAWPTFMTGKNPGRHGVFDFFVRDEHGGRRLASSRDIDGPTLWRFLSTQGRRSIVLNVPCTYPPEAIDGVLISGMLTPVDCQYAYPPEMASRLDAWTGGYRINARSKFVRSPVDRGALIRELYQVADIQKRAFLELLRREPWDFAMVMFRATDIVQHKLWHRPEDIAAMYEFLDATSAEIIAAADDAAIWLMSDHGFGPLEKLFHINVWLRDRGWLSVSSKTPPAQSQADVPPRAGQTKRAYSLQRWMARANFSRDRAQAALPPFLYSLLKRIIPDSLRRWTPMSSQTVDWNRTQVFSDSSFTQETQALRINLEGREPYGIVTPDQYESLRNEVKRALLELVDPDTGEAVVGEVHMGDQLFQGPYAASAPDLILRLCEGYKLVGGFSSRQYISRLSPTEGSHRLHGVFVATGADVAAGTDLGELSIADVMPTLLHYLGLPVPKGCDGEVRTQVFAPKSETARREIRRVEVVSATRFGPREPQADDEEVLERLRALGYVE